MKLRRREFLQLAACAAAVPTASHFANAQSTYPTRPVRVIVGFPPGGLADIYARLLTQWLSEKLGQQFIIENRAGAGGSLAADAVSKASPDGYTLILTGSNDAWNTTLYDNLNFDYIRDIAPVASLARVMGALVVSPSSPVKTVSDLIAYAKANPGKLSIASGGIGSSSHVYWELFKAMTRVEMLHVPYRGEAPALTDLLGGQVQVAIPNMPAAIEFIKSGRLRPLAVTTAVRSNVFPDTPTIGETVPGYDADSWIGIGAPRGTPGEIIDKLNSEINRALADPKITQRVNEFGDTVFANSPPSFGAFIVDFTDKWAKVIRQANIKL